MIKRALLWDLECSGLDATKDKIVEIGMVDYSLEHHAIVRSCSMLVDAGVGNAAAGINRIPPRLLVEGGEAETDALLMLRSWATDADITIGHNASNFDVRFLPDPIREGMPPLVDSCHDIEWPGRAAVAGVEPTRERPGQSLVALCLAHGVGVATAHRALADALLIAALLERVHELGHDVQAMLARAMRPKVEVVSLAPFSEKEIVKAHGFSWDAARKEWRRRIVQEDIATLPFQVRRAS